MSSQSIAFRNPPINEVVVSTYFNPPLSDLRSEHIGLFWKEIKQDFPVVSQQPPVGNRLDVGSGEPFPMPRYWFIADNEINLIQVQKNAFMFNWRRRGKEYPKYYNDIKPNFDKYYGMFSEFIRTQIEIGEPNIDLCELTYINTLQLCDYWEGPQDTGKIIPSFTIIKTGINDFNAIGFNCNYIYIKSDDLQINIGIRNGFTQQDNIPVLMFEIKASGRLGQVAKSGADEWFERAHDAIIECFLGITDQDIQNRLWQPMG